MILLIIVVSILLVLSFLAYLEDRKYGKMKSDNYESDCNYD
jgi:NADH:ubiquinone oxidoreductase subunit 3 (subunit A)